MYSDMSQLSEQDIELLKTLSPYIPASGGATEELMKLGFQAAQKVFPLLENFIRVYGTGRISQIPTSAEFCTTAQADAAAVQLAELFTKYGSDKSAKHDYQYIYAAVLKNSASVGKLLEIGLGTNNENIVSTMGKDGKPGASLRAFRDFLPSAAIYGADIDRDILFTEERIQTFYVDQLDAVSFESLGANIGSDFDLIIDDGLHSPSANLATLIFGLSRIKPGGWLVIEDIKTAALKIWLVAAALIPQGFTPHLVHTKSGLVFLVRRD